MDYIDFLMKKKKIEGPTGIKVSPEDLNKNLFDWQSEVVSWSLRKGRSALFEECGLGKTVQQLEWANQVVKKTNKNVLIVAPLAVSRQTQREGEKFGIETHIARKQKDVKKGINITNYEMLDHFDPDEFIGVVLDESSILKSFMGKTKRTLVEAFEKTPYRLSCTATPAPNDHMEILNQAEFLGIMSSSEALAMWFINDTQNMGTYRLKKHAIKPFWEWVSTWAVSISKPSDIGDYSDEGYILPKLHEHTEIVDISLLDKTLEDGFIREVKTNATAYHKEKRFTAEKRAIRTAEILAMKPDKQHVVWCDTNYEADLLKKYIPQAIEVRGSDKVEKKEESIMGFIDGEIPILISKPTIFGYGLNLQNCSNTTFCGLSYSYEDYYQALKRFHRFGQKEEVYSNIVIGSTEMNILNVINRKKELHDEMNQNMFNSIKEIQGHSIKGTKFKLNLDEINIELPKWAVGE